MERWRRRARTLSWKGTLGGPNRYGYDKATEHRLLGHRKWPWLCTIMEEKAYVEYFVLQSNIPPLCAIQMCSQKRGSCQIYGGEMSRLSKSVPISKKYLIELSEVL